MALQYINISGYNGWPAASQAAVVYYTHRLYIGGIVRDEMYLVWVKHCSRKLNFFLFNSKYGGRGKDGFVGCVCE